MISGFRLALYQCGGRYSRFTCLPKDQVLITVKRSARVEETLQTGARSRAAARKLAADVGKRVIGREAEYFDADAVGAARAWLQKDL